VKERRPTYGRRNRRRQRKEKQEKGIGGDERGGQELGCPEKLFSLGGKSAHN